MNSGQELKNLAYKVNGLLSEYIQVHDKILNTAGKSIKIFQKIDFEELLNDSKKILAKIEDIKEGLFTFQKECENDLNENEKKYLYQLIRFVEKLAITCEVLSRRQDLLYKKSESYSLLGRLMWLPVFLAPFRVSFIRIILPAIVVSAVFCAVVKGANYLSMFLMFMVGFLWLFSFTYKYRKNISWKEYNKIEKEYQQSINNYMAEGEKLNNLNKLIY